MRLRMRRVLGTGVLAAMASLAVVTASLSAGSGAPRHQPNTPVLAGTVTQVIDGDTLEVKLASGPITVRLHSVDAPERDQPYGRDAFAALYALVANKGIELEVIEQDRYDRQVAVIQVEGVNVNAELVRRGHAWAYRQYLTEPEYCRWEEEARKQKKGVWALPVAAQVAPWEWRDLDRGERFVPTDYSRQSVADCVRAAGARTAPDPATGSRCTIKGNISESGKVFHLPGSRDYDRTRIDASRGERWFCTVEEALAQGWRPSRGR